MGSRATAAPDETHWWPKPLRAGVQNAYMIVLKVYRACLGEGANMSRNVIASLVTACAIGFGAGTASAMELVPGGYGLDVDAYAPAASLSMDVREFAASAGAAGLTLDFTPRASGSLFGPSTAFDDTKSISVSLGIQEGYGQQLRLGSIGLGEQNRLSRVGNFASDDGAAGLALGGAFSLYEWQLTGSVGRASLLGESADLFAAGIGYGPVNARLVYGHVPRTGGPAGDLLMLSTDLAAWSWLTLEGDVAVSDTLVDDPLTVGRIGLRLNF